MQTASGRNPRTAEAEDLRPHTPPAEGAAPPWRRLYPWPPHYAEVSGGARMHFIDVGHGPPVVMVHGNPTWSFMFRDLVRTLAEAGRRAIAPDHVGCGLSDKPQHYPYRLDTHIANLDRLLFDHLGLESCDLVLHDWGGAIGMGVAVRRPERIRRIVLMNTAAFFLPRCPVLIRLARSPGIGEAAVRGLNLFARGALRLAAVSGTKLPPEVRAGFLAPYGSYADRVAILAFVRDIPLSPHHPTRAVLDDIERRLPALASKPVLLCWGMKDFVFTPMFLERWREIWPHAGVVTLDNAGHYLLEDAGPEVIDAVAGFFSRTEDSTATPGETPE